MAGKQNEPNEKEAKAASGMNRKQKPKKKSWCRRQTRRGQQGMLHRKQSGRKMFIPWKSLQRMRQNFLVFERRSW